MNENKTNCSNCGAPLADGRCNYCGTEYRAKQKELKCFYRGREIENPTKEMLCSPYLLFIDKMDMT